MDIHVQVDLAEADDFRQPTTVRNESAALALLCTIREGKI